MLSVMEQIVGRKTEIKRAFVLVWQILWMRQVCDMAYCQH